SRPRLRGPVVPGGESPAGVEGGPGPSPAGGDAQSFGNQIAISRSADSGESEPCTRFSRFDSDRSPRIVPGAALRPSVAPLSARTTSTASSPSSTIDTSGPLVTNVRSGG